FHSPASPAGARAALILQWANPFGSASDDYDLCVRQTNGTLLVCSRFRQTGNDDPIEAVPLTCTGPSGAVCSADLQITLFSRSPPSILSSGPPPPLRTSLPLRRS